MSVVPSRAWSCQGIANITRPSLVRGTMIAESPGRNDRSSTTCTPWLGAIIGAAAGSSIRRTASLNAPVALITLRARERVPRPLSTSSNVDAVDEPLAVVRQVRHAGVVEQRRALLVGGAGEVDQQAGIVELAVVVERPRRGGRPARGWECARGRPPLRAAATSRSRTARPACRTPSCRCRRTALPTRRNWARRRQVVDQVRRVLAEDAAFLQRLHHQRDVPLLQVAHPAMDELG